MLRREDRPYERAHSATNGAMLRRELRDRWRFGRRRTLKACCSPSNAQFLMWLCGLHGGNAQGAGSVPMRPVVGHLYRVTRDPTNLFGVIPGPERSEGTRNP